MTTTMESHTVPNTAQVAGANNPDDLGIDRAFIMSIARIPLIAVGWTAAAYASHLVWNAISPNTFNYAPLVVLCFAMVLAAVIDGWAFKVPNWLTLSMVVSGWILGGLHDAGVPVDAGYGGLGSAMICTMVGFFLLFPLLAIVGMGQGDVKMLMGFGSWIGAFFSARNGTINGLEILIWAFALGAVVGGLCGIVMMVARRKFKKNLSNFREIAVDLKVLATIGPDAAAARSSARRPGWDRLPYGVPLCVGFLGYLAYLYWQGILPAGL